MGAFSRSGLASPSPARAPASRAWPKRVEPEPAPVRTPEIESKIRTIPTIGTRVGAAGREIARGGAAGAPITAGGPQGWPGGSPGDRLPQIAQPHPRPPKSPLPSGVPFPFPRLDPLGVPFHFPRLGLQFHLALAGCSRDTHGADDSGAVSRVIRERPRAREARWDRRQHVGVEQLEARQPHKLEVAGSSPAPATTSGVRVARGCAARAR